MAPSIEVQLSGPLVNMEKVNGMKMFFSPTQTIMHSKGKKTALNRGVGACLPIIPFSQRRFMSASARVRVFLVAKSTPSLAIDVVRTL